MIYIEFKLLVYLVNYVFLIKIGKLAYFLLICYKKLFFKFYFRLDSLVCTTWTQNNTNNLPKGTTIYKTLIFTLDFPIIITIICKKALQMFCATKKCENDSKKWYFLPKQMVTEKKKECDTNKNVIKMSVIIKSIYCIWKCLLLYCHQMSLLVYYMQMWPLSTTML